MYIDGRKAKLDFLLSSIELNLSLGRKPLEAVEAAVEAYKSVYMDTDEVSTPSTHEAIAVEWMCTHCKWNGSYGDTMGVMYRGVDWQQCPVCRSVAIPSTGSTRYIR